MNRTALVLILILLISGCVREKPRTAVKPVKEKESKIVQLPPLTAPPPTFREIEREKLHEGEDVVVNLSFDNLDLKKVLLSLAKATGYNFIIDPDVSGKISIELKDVTLREALDYILTPLGYSYSFEGKSVRVIAKLTKVFHIDVPLATRGFKSNISASIGGAGSTGGTFGGGTSGVEGTATATSTANVEVTNQANVDFWKSVEDTIKSLIGSDNSTTYTVEPISGTVIVSGKPEAVKRVGKFIESLNAIVNRQVLIEAKIVEVNLKKGYETGVNWQVLGDYKNYNYSFNLNTGSPGKKPFQVQVLKFSKDFSALIGLLARFGSVNVLSSPRILAMNNQPAIIKVGKDYILIYRTQSSTTTGVGGQTASAVTTQEVKTETVFTEGIVLTIVPKIDSDGNIILNITPAVSSIETPLVSGSSGETSEFVNRVYAVNVRQLNAMVKVRDGETIILGGLIAKRKSKEEIGIPIAKDIPLIGNAFKSTKSESNKSELVIMLTPHLERR